MLSPKEYLRIVNERIAAINYPSQPSGLYEPIAYTMALGGKRLRPTLVLMACDALGGEVGAAVDVAVGLEMFHNFTLLHDDVMDRADVRRGKPTVHVKWNDNTAILSGDAMLTMASQLIAAGPQSVMTLFNRTAMEIYEGQQYDVDFESRNDVAVEEYMEMIRLKTSVLLGCACAMGAMMAGASEHTTQSFYKYGEYLGLAFQLQDDMLDVWGDPATFGKEIGGDIMNNKKTFLLISAQQQAIGEDQEELNRWLAAQNPDRDSKVNAVRGIYESLGLRQQAYAKIVEYTQKALSELEKLNLPADAHEAFASFASKLVDRSV